MFPLVSRGKAASKETTAKNKVCCRCLRIGRGLNLPAGSTGSYNSVAIFFALKKDGLPALAIQFGFSPYTSNSPETLVEPKLPPVLFPRVPTYTLPLATVGTVNLTAFPA